MLRQYKLRAYCNSPKSPAPSVLHLVPVCTIVFSAIIILLFICCGFTSIHVVLVSVFIQACKFVFNIKLKVNQL